MIPIPKTNIIIDYKIIHMRTFGLSMQNKGPAIVKLTVFHVFFMVIIILYGYILYYFALIVQMCACK